MKANEFEKAKMLEDKSKLDHIITSANTQIENIGKKQTDNNQMLVQLESKLKENQSLYANKENEKKIIKEKQNKYLQ